MSYARHTPTLSGTNKIRAVSLDAALFPHVGDVLTALTNEEEWKAVGDDIADVVAACKASVESWYSDMLIGMVATFALSSPEGWLELDGTTYAKADYPELYDLVPSAWTTSTHFTLPDVQDVFIAGAGSSGTPGATGGQNSTTLTIGQLPAHTHNYTMPVAAPDTVGAGAPIPSVMSVTPSTPTSSTGSGNAIENRPEYLTMVIAIFSGRG